MSKICCIGDADVDKKTSSCSMILRSACSHNRQSRESSTASKKSRSQRSQTPHKSKYNHKVSEKDIQSLPFGYTFKSSLKELALKSSKNTYSLFRDYLYNSYLISENSKEKGLEANSVTVSCSKELRVSHTSDTTKSAFDASCGDENCFKKYSSLGEHGFSFNDSVNSTSRMSRTRITRSAISSVRSLSGSEGEDEISVEKITRARKRSFDTNYSISQPSLRSAIRSNGHHLIDSQTSYAEKYYDLNSNASKSTGSSQSTHQSTVTESSTLDRSSLQYTFVDRFRWFFWRCVYLKIIRNINFDVWLLSRLHNYGKYKAIFFFLLPLILYIIWGILSQNTFPYEAVSQNFNSAVSPILMFFSSLFSSLYNLTIQREDPAPMYDTDEKQCFSNSLNILPYFSSLWNLSLFSGWFTKNIESTETLQKETVAFNPSREFTPQSTESQKSRSIIDEVKVSLTKEEIKLLAIEVFRKEINSLNNLHLSEQQNEKAKWVDKEKRFHQKITSLQTEFESLSGTVGKLGKIVLEQEKKNQNTDQILSATISFKKEIDDLNLKLKTIGDKIAVLDKLKTCCESKLSESDFLAMFQKNLVAAFKNVIGDDSHPSSQYYFFTQWLNEKFFSRETFVPEINAAFKRFSAHQETDINHDFVIKVVESTVFKYVESIKKNLTKSTSNSLYSIGHDFFSEDKIKRIIKEAIMLYDADKTGQVDYALESGGGSVLGTRCTETYSEKNGKFILFGVPLWSNSNSPRTAIQPDMQPGRCWSFKGSQGFLVLELSATIYPTGFTLEHIPVSLSPTGSIDSAPNKFSVLGLESEKDNSGILLGEYTYDINADPLQYFKIQNLPEKPYSYVELQIHSNHGNIEYTCLYRFRVHGQRA